MDTLPATNSTPEGLSFVNEDDSPLVQSGFATGHDGTRIAYRVYGNSGPWFVIANGHGATWDVWSRVLELLKGDARVLIWNYRGQYESELPANPLATSIEDHCLDLDILLSKLSIENYVMAGWSLGVQVALAQYRRMPHRIDGLTLIHGAHDRLVQRVFGGRPARVLQPWMQLASRTTRYIVPVLRPLIRRWLRTPLAMPTFRTLGVIQVEDEKFVEMAQGYTALDFEVFLKTALSANAHRTEEWLHEITVPTLVTVGLADGLTPPHQMVALRDRIPDVVWQEFEGSHFPMLEAPDELAAAIRRHLLEATETFGRTAKVRPPANGDREPG